MKTVTVERTTPDRAPRTHEAPEPESAVAEFKRCDANIEVRAATTTCEFAQNVFRHYWTDGHAPTLSVYSPAVGTDLQTSCSESEARVVCTTADRGFVRFSQTAIDSYSPAQADRYAATHDLGPDPTPYPDTSPEPSDPEAGSASAGQNIPNYDNGRGYRVQCEDGMYSKSGGIQGACSGHGGVKE